MWSLVEDCGLIKGKKYLCRTHENAELWAVYAGKQCFYVDDELWFNVRYVATIEEN